MARSIILLNSSSSSTSSWWSSSCACSDFCECPAVKIYSNPGPGFSFSSLSACFDNPDFGRRSLDLYDGIGKPFFCKKPSLCFEKVPLLSPVFPSVFYLSSYSGVNGPLRSSSSSYCLSFSATSSAFTNHPSWFAACSAFSKSFTSGIGGLLEPLNAMSLTPLSINWASWSSG